MFRSTFWITTACILAVAALALSAFNNYQIQKQPTVVSHTVVQPVKEVTPSAVVTASPSATVVPAKRKIIPVTVSPSAKPE